jgi:hypothetical protein
MSYQVRRLYRAPSSLPLFSRLLLIVFQTQNVTTHSPVRSCPQYKLVHVICSLQGCFVPQQVTISHTSGLHTPSTWRQQTPSKNRQHFTIQHDVTYPNTWIFTTFFICYCDPLSYETLQPHEWAPFWRVCVFEIFLWPNNTIYMLTRTKSFKIL